MKSKYIHRPKSVKDMKHKRSDDFPKLLSLPGIVFLGELLRGEATDGNSVSPLNEDGELK